MAVLINIKYAMEIISSEKMDTQYITKLLERTYITHMFLKTVPKLLQIFPMIGTIVVDSMVVLYLEIMLFYKWFRRMMFKHKQKKPQYYAPREISIVPHTPGNFKGKVPEGMQPSLGMQMPDQEQGAQNPNGKIN